MTVNNLYSSFTFRSKTEDISEKSLQDRKILKKNVSTLLTPALEVFTKNNEPSSSVLESLTRLTTIEKRELLEKSALNKARPKKTIIASKENPTVLLGQIHADALAVNNLLETLSPAEGAQAWADLVREAEEIRVPSELQASLDQYAKTSNQLSSIGKDSNIDLEIIKHGKDISRKIYELKVGESFLLEGGRRKDSHEQPIVFEFIRMSENAFDLYVYLSGKEEPYLEQVIESGKKIWNRPIVYYKNIPADTHLFFGNNENIKSDFFQAILEARLGIFKLPPEHLTLNILAHLQSFRSDLPQVISERRALTDAWSSLKPFILRKLGRDAYKALILDIKLNSLIQGFNKAKNILADDTPESEQLRIVLKRGAQLILKNLASLHISQIHISENLFLTAHATALDLLDELQRIDKDISTQRKEKSYTLLTPNINKNELQETYKSALEKAKSSVHEPSQKSSSIYTTRARLIEIPSPEFFPDEIERFVNQYDSNVKVPGIQTAEIEHLVAQMPIPKSDSQSFWNKIPSDKLMTTLSALDKMSFVFANATHQMGAKISAKESNTIYTLYAIIHHLSLAYDKVIQTNINPEHPASLAHYPIYFPGMDTDADPYLLFVSPEDYQRWEELIAYFKNSYELTQKHNTAALFQLEKELTFSTYHKEPIGLCAYLFALTDDPRFQDPETDKFLQTQHLHDTGVLANLLRTNTIKRAFLVSELVRCLNRGSKKSPFLIKKGFGHLPILTYSATLAHLFTGYKHHLREFPSIYSTFDEKKILGVPNGFWLNITWGGYEKKIDSSNLYPILREDQKLLLNKEWSKRNKSSNTSKEEAQVLQSIVSNKKNTTDEIAFLRSSCEPSLFPHKLLSYYRGKLDLFESLEEQILFELAFFRSVALNPPWDPNEVNDSYRNPYKRIRFFPAADEIKQAGFQNQAKLFIQEGIDRYFFRQPNQKPKVLAVTFFLRLACRLSRFCDGSSFIDNVDLIEKMMAVPSIYMEEKSLLSIHLVLAYSSFKRELTKNEVEKIFGAWVYYKNTALPGSWYNLFLEKEAETIVHQASTFLSNNLDLTFQEAILKTALKQLGVQLPSSFTISPSQEPHLIEGKGNNSDVWAVNILTGDVMSRQGILRRTRTPPAGLKNNTFRYIFGDFNPSFFETSSCYYFLHPQLGTFRAVPTGISSHPYAIQKPINEDWYQYISPEMYLQSIPRFLCGNKTHWINTNPSKSDILICERETGNNVARMHSNGLIETEDQEEIWGLPQTTLFTTFERPEYIHWSINKEGKTTLNFSRYQSLGQHPLSFEVDHKALVLTSNRKYMLSNQQKPGLLGAKNGSLLLVNRETGAEKVIAPLKPLIRQAPLATQHEIDVKDRHMIYQAPGEYYIDQKDRFEFVEFDVKAGTLIPLAQEGIPYLAYHYLTQRKYEEAFYSLKQIDFRDALSQISQDFLTKIIHVANSAVDTSPEAAAVALHAWVLFKRAALRMKAENKSFNPPPNHTDSRSIYCRFEHQIPENLLLNSEDKRLCGILQNSQKNDWVYPEIKQIVPSPLRKQKYISRLIIERSDLVFAAGFLAEANIELPWNLPKEEFKKLIEQAKKNILWATPFIPLEAKPSNFTTDCLRIQDWTSEFEEAFFPIAYEIARNKRGTELDRKLLIFKMQVMELAVETKSKSWNYLQLALKYPDQVPELPNPKSYKARYEFVNKCAELSQKVQLEDVNLSKEPRASFRNEAVRLITAPILPQKTVENVSKPLELAPFSKENIDGGFTEKIFANYFVKKDKPKSSSVEFPASFDESLLEENEKQFLSILNSEFKEFAEDYKEGVKINAQREFYSLENSQGLQKELESEVATLNSQLALLESSILELANKHDPNDKKTTLYKHANIEQELGLKKLADLFLQGDADAFAKANSFLRNRGLIEKMAHTYGLSDQNENIAIEYLYNQMGLYMTLSTHKMRLQRAIKLCKDLKKEGLTRDSLVQKLADELKPLEKPVYSIKDYPAFLVFEYLSGLSIRPQQAILLEKLLECKNGKYVNRVIQLIMGGGKTSVLAVILLKLAAKKGRLSLFVTPASQYASVSYNLRKSLRDCFGIEMEEMDVTRESLANNLDLCEEVLNRLREAVEGGNFLLIKAETLQALDLAFIDFIYQDSQETSRDPVLIKKINVLKDILILLADKGDGLFDEIDLLLNVLHELNFPVGEVEFVAAERIEVIRELFLLLNQKVSIDGTTFDLDKIIGLRSNRQNLVSPKEWKTTVAKAVARILSSKLESLKLQGRPDLIESFERYLNGQMNKECQRKLDLMGREDITLTKEIDQKDFEFLLYVKTLRKSKDPTEQEAAHHMALIKHMMQTVLPVTFEKKGKRNYGRGGSAPGEVRPYLAVDTPSENLIGYHWEAVAYHFQTALQCGINKEQLLHIAKIYKTQAEIQSEREKRVFDQTMEAIEFKELTGISLHELDNPEKIDAALDNLNKNLEALLRFEADTAGEYVSYYKMRLTATGQTLVNMLSTVRAMSGTPWNAICFPSSLSNNFEPAVGTEGQIAEAILSRAHSKTEDKKYTHVIKSKEITEILKELLDKHPQKDRVRLLMDSGALFENYSNIEVAKAIRDYLKIPVLFFMRNPRKKEKTPDTLALLRVGSDKPDIIGGTRLEDIQTTGLNVEDYFVFDDDRHTTGTDIPLIPDAIGLMTVDETMLRRTLFQTIMRERDFFLNQEVEFVIPEYLLKILKKLIKDHKVANEDVERILESHVLSIKNQVIAKSKHYYRSCKQKIDAVFRKSLRNVFLTKEPLTHEFIVNSFPAFQATTFSMQTDSPYDQFGALEYAIDSKESLRGYCARKLDLFPDQHPLKKTIATEMQAILKEAEQSVFLPTTVLEAGSQDLGMQVDVLTEVAAEVNQQVDQDIDQDKEILRELEIYQRIKEGRLREEENWSDEKIETFLLEAKRNQVALKNLSSLFDRQHFQYQKNYTNVFSSGILATDAWIYSTDRSLPVFHKMQRPLDQILIIKGNKGFQAIALAQREAQQFKSYLKRNQKTDIHQGIWLIQADGSLLQDTLAGSLPVNEKKIQEFLVECNVFNGRIDYLDSHEQFSSAWLNENNGNFVKIKKDFLKLRVINNPLQKKLFNKSEVFAETRVKESQKKYRWRMVSNEMKSLSKEEIQALTENDGSKLKSLLPEQLNMLKPKQIKLLKGYQISDLTQPELIQEIPENYVSYMQLSQLQHIAPKQVPWFKDSIAKTQAIPGRLCAHMEDAQLKCIVPSQVVQIEDKETLKRLVKINPSALAHVTSKQVKDGLVDETIAPHLRKAEAIQELPVPLLQHVEKSLRQSHLKSSQVSELSKEHPNLIHDLTEKQVKWLSREEQLLELEERQLDWLDPSQIFSLARSPELVKKLKSNAAHLHTDAVPHIDDSQVQYLQTIDQIKALHPTQYSLLEKIQIEKLTSNESELITAISKDPSKQAFLSKKQKKAISKKSPVISQQSQPERKDLPVNSAENTQNVEIEKKKSITKIVLCVLAAFVATGMIVAGTFALMGALWSHAPQFTIVIFHAFQAPLVLPCVTAGGGTLFLVGLLAFAIHTCRSAKKAQKMIKKETLTSKT